MSSQYLAVEQHQPLAIPLAWMGGDRMIPRVPLRGAPTRTQLY